MPVRDLSDRTRVTRLGKIRLGEKAVTDKGVEYPVARPYFVLPDELKAVYGDQPTEIRIVFLSDDEEQIVPQYYRSYNASHGRVCVGDGYKADALLDADELAKRGGDLTPVADLWAHGRTRNREATKNVVRHEVECLGAGYDGRPACPMYQRGDCGVKMFLQAAVVGAPGLGVYQIDTGSVIGIGNVNGAIRMVKAMTRGHVAGIRFLLKRVKTEVSPPPEMRKKTIWTIALEVDPALNAGRLLAQSEEPPIYALMPPPDETDAAEAFNEETVDGENGAVVQADGAGEGIPESASRVGPTKPPPGERRRAPRGRAAGRPENGDGQSRTPVSANGEARRATDGAIDPTPPPITPPSGPSQPQPAAPPPTETLDILLAEINRLLVDCKQTWAGMDYVKLYVDLRDAYTPSGAGKLDLPLLNLDQARTCLAEIRRRRGEPVAPPTAVQDGAPVSQVGQDGDGRPAGPDAAEEAEMSFD